MKKNTVSNFARNVKTRGYHNGTLICIYFESESNDALLPFKYAS